MLFCPQIVMASNTPAVMPCGVNSVSQIAMPSSSPPSNPVTPLVGGGINGVSFSSIDGIVIQGNYLYVADNTTKKVWTFNLSDGSTVRSFLYTTSFQSITVDPSGNIYISHDYAYVDQYTPTGTLNWSVNAMAAAGFSDASDHMFGWNSSNGFRVMLKPRNHPAIMVDSTGAVVGTSPIVGAYVFQTGTTHLVTVDDEWNNPTTSSLSYVHVYNGSGNQTFYFGANVTNPGNIPDSDTGWTFKPAHGGAIQFPDGKFYINNFTKGIERFSSQGIYEGLVEGSTINSNIYSNWLAYSGTNVYFLNSNSTQIDYISRSDLDSLINAPKGVNTTNDNNFLGLGTMLYTTVLRNYFPSDQTPQVSF